MSLIPVEATLLVVWIIRAMSDILLAHTEVCMTCDKRWVGQNETILRFDERLHFGLHMQIVTIGTQISASPLIKSTSYKFSPG